MRTQKTAEAKGGMELWVSCRDVGVDCDYVAHGRTEEELFKNAAEHGKSAHQMEQIPPEIVEKVRAAIHYKGMEGRNFNTSDEVRRFDKGILEIINMGGRTIGRATLQPGWRWSKSVKPLVNTKSCEAPHFQYHVSGTLRVKMDDGTEKDFKAGDVSLLSAGHDAWVMGDHPVVIVDFQGMADYAKGSAKDRN
jgi:predicted small metal-binding protein